jgi:hypothetical protein
METNVPLNSVNAEFYRNELDQYEIKRLRKANTNYKLQVIELKQKLESIINLITKNKNK